MNVTPMPVEGVTAFAPGRVNLIGEHTDYNGGLALPFAIERGVTVTAEPAAGADVVVTARELGEDDRFPAAAPPRAGGWRGLVRGVVAELRAPPCTIEITSDLPVGAGLSSSAALTVALALALGELASPSVESAPHAVVNSTLDLARLCQRVENDWTGARTGLLDQLAIVGGRSGAATRIDFSTLEMSSVPLELGGYSLALLDSGAPRSLGDSGYNERRAECEEACALLGVSTLREADGADLDRLPGGLGRRVRHVLDENHRVDEAVRALGASEPHRLGALLDASHASLRDLYDCSTPEVERTVARLKRAGAGGARMVGGGFGGSVLGLFPPGADPPAHATVVRPAAGARRA